MVQNLQNLLVVGVVLGSSIYVLWTLCPKVLRGKLATRLLAGPHPAWLNRYLLAAAKQQGGCGCDGCDRAPEVGKTAGKTGGKTPGTTTADNGLGTACRAPAGYQPLVFQPRAKTRSVLGPKANQ
ncbi:MAG: hypothetical protein ORN29_04660 [Rhodoferax sp.]|nr:hypothetical protein [Rhodoferax sp.]